MDTIGKLIQRKRIANNLSIEDISHSLKVKSIFLVAIENDDLDKFISKAYYYGYLKQYLKLLEIDYKNLVPSSHEMQEQNLSVPTPIIEYFHPNFIFILVSLVLLIVSYNLCSNFIEKKYTDPIHQEFIIKE